MYEFTVYVPEAIISVFITIFTFIAIKTILEIVPL